MLIISNKWSQPNLGYCPAYGPQKEFRKIQEISLKVAKLLGRVPNLEAP
jgi:hypothetical protein